ncbi:MAG: penicillin-binding protein 2, partial [Alphaproteobacteria bacterium]|nr:penicillin-binding protein 2 [Alphaproteobacteria bacterium]
PEILSHVIGYTGAPTKSDIEKFDNSALSVPTARIGKTGIERQYEGQLFGRAGTKHIEVDSRHRFVRDIDNISPAAGEDLILTIDLALQRKVAELVSQHESATCVVMDVHTGAILAFVSHPGYDANLFTQRVKSSELKALHDNPYKPMINKLIHGLYSPGSAFKMMTGLAALKKGVITKHTRFTCRGVYELGRQKFHCWRWKCGGHGSVNLQEALAGSCDVFFYNLARLLSPDEIAATARDFGLGEPTGIDLPDEKSGLIPTKSWKKKHKKQSWTTGDTFNMAIGQGFVLTTPLQLVKMVAILTNGLKPITPHLVERKTTDDPTPLKYDPEHIQTILDGMYDVVNAPYGTAWNAGLDDFEFCGKTGSSQVFRITERLRREGKTVSDDYWKKEHAIFVGYAPADVPRVAIAVLVEHGGSGAHTAAPLARDVLLAAKTTLGF